MSSAFRHALGDHQSLSFEQRGAENAVRCMGVTAQDRVFIMTGDERESIACHVADAVLAQHADVIVRLLERYGARPMTDMPAELHTDLLKWHPTVTYYIASTQPGEITFRLALRTFLVQKLKVRHGHVLGIKVQNSYVTEITSEDHALAQEVGSYLFSTSNGNRVGEFAIGTMLGLKKLVGNPAQDEKMPGLHVAFSHPYPQFTGADWDAPIHVDVIPSNCTIEVDGCIILRNGTFTLEKGNRR